MKHVVALWICFLVGSIVSIHAQNIVNNPGFETFGTVPCGWTGSGIDFANAVPGFTSPTSATPDVFSTLIPLTCSNNQPHTSYVSPNGWQAPHGGDLFGGFYTYVGGSTWREYIQASFSQPMIPGTKYIVSFYISLADNSQFATNNIGVEFYTFQQAMPISNEIGTTPTINFSQVMSDSTNWVLFSDTVTATAAYTHMVIGNFFNDAGTTVVPFWSSATWDRTYYYVDDISVIPVSISASNFCFGDTTLFDNAQLNGWVATAWNYGDTASGSNNVAFTLNGSHVFSAPGNYIVTTVNYYFNGSTDTILTNVTISPAPVINLGTDTTLCNGQTLLLDAGSGYLYNWSTGDTIQSITIDTAGVYWVVADDNGCVGSDTIVVSNTNCLPVIALASSDTSFCEKQCIDFYDLSTNSPTSWLWLFPGADSTSSTLQNPTNICYNSYGSFDVTLIACNAIGCDTLFYPAFINEYQSPVNTIWGSNDTLHSQQFATYQWYEVTNGLIPGAIDSIYVITAPGSYYCLTTDSIGCETTSNIISVTSINQLFGSAGVSVFPNPNEGVFTISPNEALRNEAMNYVITDAAGKVIYKLKAVTGMQVIQLQMAAGLYFLQVSTQNGIMESRKLFIED